MSAACAGGLGFERGRARHDAEPAQKLRLRDRSVTVGAHGLHRAGQRLEIHMRGEIDAARARSADRHRRAGRTACKVSPAALSAWP